MNNLCRGFLVTRSYLPSILLYEIRTAATLIGSYQWCNRVFPHILPDFSLWPFSDGTSSALTNALQMSSHWNQPSQFCFGCCRCVLLGHVLTTWWAPRGGIKWSYLKRLNKQDTAVSDTFHSRSAACILNSVLFALLRCNCSQVTGKNSWRMPGLLELTLGISMTDRKNKRPNLKRWSFSAQFLPKDFMRSVAWKKFCVWSQDFIA